MIYVFDFFIHNQFNEKFRIFFEKMFEFRSIDFLNNFVKKNIINILSKFQYNFDIIFDFWNNNYWNILLIQMFKIIKYFIKIEKKNFHFTTKISRNVEKYDDKKLKNRYKCN